MKKVTRLNNRVPVNSYSNDHQGMIIQTEAVIVGKETERFDL